MVWAVHLSARHSLAPSGFAFVKHAQQSLLLVDAQCHVQVNLVAVLAYADLRFDFSYLDVLRFLCFCHGWKSSTPKNSSACGVASVGENRGLLELLSHARGGSRHPRVVYSQFLM
jgi:hypothetical protein